MNLRLCMMGLSAIAAFTVLAGAASAQPTFRTVVLRTDPLPGIPEGAIVQEVISPLAIGNTGIATFWLRLVGVPPGTGFTLWTETPNGPALLLRYGDMVPAVGGATIQNGLEPLRVLDDGRVLTYLQLVGEGSQPGVDDFALVLLEDGEEPVVVVRRGDSAPDVDDGTLTLNIGGGSGFLSPSVSASGRIAFYNTLAGEGINSSNNQGIWGGELDDFRLIARRGSPAPGLIDVDYGSLFVVPPMTNNSGQVLFSSLLQGQGVTSQNDQAVWLSPGTGTIGVSMVIREDDEAPGVDAGRFSGVSFYGTQLADDGTILIASSLRGPAGIINSTNNFGIWITREGALELVVRTGDSAPGGSRFAVISNNRMRLNNLGRVAFVASLVFEDGIGFSNDSGIWAEDMDGELRLVVRENDPAPGFSTGVVFDDFTAGGIPIMNGLGQIAFRGRVRGPGINSGNNTALFLADADGTLHLLARIGGFFDINDDPDITELRQITAISFDGTQHHDNPKEVFNDQGELVFALTFAAPPTAPLSGIFTTAPVVVAPPPTCQGDLNNDGVVNTADLGIMLSGFGCSGGDCIADLNSDEAVDTADLGILLARFGTICD